MKKNLLDIKYDAIVVLSGGDDKTTSLRIEKALKLYHDGKSDILVLNGFNSDEKHDPGFNGSLYDDSRLKGYRDEIEQIHPFVLYARNTEENAYEIKKLCRRQRWKKIAVVTSKTHIPRVEQIYHKFFPNYLNIDFISAEEPSEKQRKKQVVLEILERIVTGAELCGLQRGRGPGTDRKIYQVAEYRKYKFDKINDLVKKILGC